MGSGERRAGDGSDEAGDLLEATLADMIMGELKVRDEFLAFCAEIEELPREGPEAEQLRETMSARAAELRGMIEQRALYLRAMPSPWRLYERVIDGLDKPGCETKAEHVALVAESAAAALAAIAAQVRLLAEMRRRGLPT